MADAHTPDPTKTDAENAADAKAAAPKPKMVKVHAIKYHTTAGKEYHAGDTYEVAEDAVANLVAQGMAGPTEPPAKPAAKPSHPVEPMTTTNAGLGPNPTPKT